MQISIPSNHVTNFFIATGRDALVAETAADCEVYFYHSPPRSTEMLLSPQWHPDGQVYDAHYELLHSTGLSILSASTTTNLRSVFT